MHARTRGNGQSTPGSVAVWVGADTTPAPIVGTVCRVFRASDSSVSQGSGNNKLPNSFFDTIDVIGNGITWDSVQGRATVSKAGMYIMDCRLEKSSQWGNTITPMVTFRKNGAVASWGVPADTSSGILITFTASKTIAHQALLYLRPGDYIEPGTWLNSSASLVGDAVGALSYFSLSRLSDAAG